MITAVELAKFAEKNGWIIIKKGGDYIHYLTPSGQRVTVLFFEDGSIQKVLA